jgi:glycosyltransferase involved in cell wall biosynthesis
MDISKYSNLIVYSHLRWDHVTQRPQHLITRLSKNRKTVFVEEPIIDSKYKKPFYKLLPQSRNLWVCKTYFPRKYSTKKFSEILTRSFKRLKISQLPITWYYSAAYIELALFIPSGLVVYDCMDELSAFNGASNDLINQEKKLLNLADVVFTGGKSLYEAKRKYNKNTYCFPSSVEAKHFQKALYLTTRIPKAIASIPHPIVGYYGVIDERIDYKLLETISKSNPKVSFVMIGPTAKIDPKQLPNVSNLFFLGQQPYKHLPGFLKAFDIAMMPFALNAATKFISPTKTLEYMAAAKPIISTPIFDVKRDYSQVVQIVDSSKQFTKSIASFLTENKSAKNKRNQIQQRIVDTTSWDKTAKTMENIFLQALQKKLSATKTVLSPSAISILAYE